MFWRRRTRLDEEIASHLAEEMDDNVARGMEPVQARRAALRTFGNVAAAKERARELDPLYWLDTLGQDVQFAFRLIARDRWVSLLIVATLTLGIAVNLSVFGLLNALLLRPWVQSEPETFVSVIPRFSGKYPLRFSDYGSMSRPDYLHYREAATSLESLAAYRLLSVTLSGRESGSLRGALVSCNLFDVLRPGAPVLGRYLRDDECATAGSTAVAVLSESAWRTRFDADPGMIGRIVHLNRLPFTVVGVAPTVTLPGDAGGLTNDSDVWMPYSMLGGLRPQDEYFADQHAQWLMVVGRRHRTASLAQVQLELSALARRADERVPGRVTSLLATDGSLVRDPEMRSRAPVIFAVTLGTASLLLLLACLNVTMLLLSRAAARQREIAVRLSLGASRLRLIRQLLTESFVLSGIAAAFSLVIAQAAPAALWQSVMSRPAPFDLTPDWRVLGYGLGVTLLVGIAAGLSPAFESLRSGVADSLKGSSTATTPGRRRAGLRAILVGVQVALSLLLVLQVSIFTRAQRRFFSYDPGFETGQVLNLTLSSVRAGFRPGAGFYPELQARVKALPAVQEASYVSLAPWWGRNSTELSEIDGTPIAPTRDFRRDPARRLVDPGFFAALDIPIARGRVFGPHPESRPPQLVPAVISEAMARRYWPDQDPLGRRFRAGAVYEVVGVCRDVQSVASMQDDGPFYYAALDLATAPAYLLIRVTGDPGTTAASVRDIVRQIDPQMAATVNTLASVIEREGQRLQPFMTHGTTAGLLGMLLALTGVYGVVSFSVSQRIREIGIRVALGARRADVMALVLKTGVKPILAGLMAGVGLSLAVSSVLGALPIGLHGRDPLILTGVPLALFLAALVAVWIPARRAAAVDPLLLLRTD